jgi:hypothetical protein
MASDKRPADRVMSPWELYSGNPLNRRLESHAMMQGLILDQLATSEQSSMNQVSHLLTCIRSQTMLHSYVQVESRV